MISPHAGPGPDETGPGEPRDPGAGDAVALRGLAHPLRVRLLAALRDGGPATASELGRRLGESSGSTSYHLRQLARYGYVTPDERQPSRREKRWRVPPTTFHPGHAPDREYAPRLTPSAVRRLLGELDALVGRYERECASSPHAGRVQLAVRVTYPNHQQPCA